MGTFVLALGGVLLVVLVLVGWAAWVFLRAIERADEMRG